MNRVAAVVQHVIRAPLWLTESKRWSVRRRPCLLNRVASTTHRPPFFFPTRPFRRNGRRTQRAWLSWLGPRSAPMSLSSPPASAPRPSSSSSSPSSSILHLYAELLLHIRTVTFFASLRTDHTEQTRAELSADGESITLTHEGERASIRLPTRVVGGGSAALTLPASPAKELSLRLQLKERSPGGLLKGGAGGGENVVPWDAGRLAECGRVECRGCGREVVKVGKSGDDGAEEVEVKADEAAPSEERGRGVKKWMDLPNENWAEMMDFWHCHKPHEHHLPGHTHTRDGVGKEKGYAASNRIMAKKGVGYVDLAYLLLTEEDCLGVQVRSRLQASLFRRPSPCLPYFALR